MLTHKSTRTNKRSAHGRACRILGLSRDHKAAYVVYVPSTNRIIVSQDVLYGSIEVRKFVPLAHDGWFAYHFDDLDKFEQLDLPEAIERPASAVRLSATQEDEELFTVLDSTDPDVAEFRIDFATGDDPFEPLSAAGGGDVEDDVLVADHGLTDVGTMFEGPQRSHLDSIVSESLYDSIVDTEVAERAEPHQRSDDTVVISLEDSIVDTEVTERAEL